MLIPNAKAVGEMAESSPTVPEATYAFRVFKVTYVDKPKNPNAKGPYLNVQHVITGPGEEYVGRMVFQIYSLTGDGSFRLRELLTATGHPDDFRLTDTDNLVGLEFLGAVIIRKGNAEYPNDKNEIKRHMPLV